MNIKAVFIVLMTVVAEIFVPDLYFNDIMKRTSIFRRPIVPDYGYDRFFEKRRPLTPKRYRNYVRIMNQLGFR